MKFIVPRLLNYTKFWLFIALILSIFSCNLINPDEEIPTYFKIPKFKIETNLSNQGSNSDCITDVWVNIDGNLQGIYELPAKFPILASGNHEITLRAGIKNNGIAASRIIYPFYTFFVIDTILDVNKTMVIEPMSTYKNECVFIWTEDFENSGITLKTTAKSDTSLIINTTEVFEGNNSGAIFLDNSHRLFECQALDSVFLPRDNSPIFMEMNYKSNLVQASGSESMFIVGMFITNQQHVVQNPIIYINSTNNEWKKIYIDLSQMVIGNFDAKYFHLFIGASIDQSVNSAEIYIDNLKIIHF